MNRDRLGSRLGFILLSAGCAIGCGNVWKFPWLTGQFGGGAFVLIYLFFLVILGWPVMTMEFALGRASQKSPVHMYQVLEPAGTKWHWHGIAALVGNVVLMMFYMVVTGWMLQYFFYTATGEFSGKTPIQVAEGFGALLANPTTQIINTVLIAGSAFLILSFSLRGGLERVIKWMMMAQIVIMLIVAVNNLFMDGVKDGLRFYLLPDFSKIS